MTANSSQGLLESSSKTPGAAALLLAITQTLSDENRIKQLVAKNGLVLCQDLVQVKERFFRE